MLLVSNDVLQLNKSERYDKTDTYNVGPCCVRTLTQDGQTEKKFTYEFMEWTEVQLVANWSPVHSINS